ncbi:FtsX-like permease family protein [Actinokineospora sp. G85]|uniref:ABC transporter permease n=1 Tax=Actinokineospora sp. G85 TaxID=3406626 RepID=UPI003C73DE01
MSVRTDLGIGVRLAVGGGRTAMTRLVLGAIGVGVAVAVLLLAASVGPLMQARSDRANLTTVSTEAIAGVEPLYERRVSAEHRGDGLDLRYVNAGGPSSPVPPGADRVPAPGEAVVSPALAERLADPDAADLRQRLPERIVGTLPASVLTDPHDLTAYLGVGPEVRASDRTSEVYSYGGFPVDESLDPTLLLLVLLGTVALLAPVFVFTAASTRIAGAERDRRLSALRLVGADSRQVRRIATAEALVSAIVGLVVGTGLFFAGRALAPEVTISGVTVNSADVTPIWWLAVAVVVLVPVLAVLTAQFALRRTIVEPLGVVRFAKPIRRRLLWRLGVAAAGVGLLFWHGGAEAGHDLWIYSITAGAALLLFSVPALLPWVVERSVSRVRGGPTSWQLAVRRLQLDAGTSARVVGGVAVVLAGAIALQSALYSQFTNLGGPQESQTAQNSGIELYPEAGLSAEAERLVAGVPGVRQVFTEGTATFVGSAEEDIASIPVYDCAAVQRLFAITDCAPGVVYAVGDTELQDYGLRAGEQWWVYEWDRKTKTTTRGASWTVPRVRSVPESAVSGDLGASARPASLFVTPGFVPDGTEGMVTPRIRVSVDAADQGVADRVYAALAPLSWQVVGVQWGSRSDDDRAAFTAISRGLLIGSVFTLLLAGLSLLVLALEHIRERRRPLAVLAASGVPTGALGRSLLWQIAIPIAVGVVIAIGAGIGLTALVLRLGSTPMVVDWSSVGLMVLAATVLAGLVWAATLPFLRGATRLTSLRTE